MTTETHDDGGDWPTVDRDARNQLIDRLIHPQPREMPGYGDTDAEYREFRLDDTDATVEISHHPRKESYVAIDGDDGQRVEIYLDDEGRITGTNPQD